MSMQILPLCTFTYTLIRYRQLRTVVVIVVVYWRGIDVRPEESGSVWSRYGFPDTDTASSVSLCSLQ